MFLDKKREIKTEKRDKLRNKEYQIKGLIVRSSSMCACMQYDLHGYFATSVCMVIGETRLKQKKGHIEKHAR